MGGIPEVKPPTLKEGRKKERPFSGLVRSFGFAFQGLFYVIRTQRNMRIHLLAGLLVILAAFFFKVSAGEWAALLAIMALIYALEMVNTVIEAVVDLITPEFHPLAKIAKDVAAGSVLMASIMAVGIGIIVFLPRLIQLF